MSKMTVEEIKELKLEYASIPANLADTATSLYSDMEGMELLIKDTITDVDQLRATNEELKAENERLKGLLFQTEQSAKMAIDELKADNSRLSRYERAWEKMQLFKSTFPESIRIIGNECGIEEVGE